MTDPKHDRTTDRCDFYFAKLIVALELRKTHGIIFAAAFLDQFPSEIIHAASRAVLLSRGDDELTSPG